METIIKHIKEVLDQEAKAIYFVRDKIGVNFAQAVETIYNSNGKLVVSGIGKSGLVGKKIVATLNSTGTYSIFLHPVEAMHGDLGMVGKNDVFIGMSNSGETSELNLILSSIKKIGCPIISFTGNTNSTLARESDITIDVGVEKEACPLGLAPTSSTTALLAAGDALAVALIYKRGFKKEDFKKFHPGGSLGKRLSMKIEELMFDFSKTPYVKSFSKVKEAVAVLDEKSLGAVFIVDDAHILKGLITDGDIRHNIAKGINMHDIAVEDIMTKSPLFARLGSPVYDALNLMEENEITVLPVVDSECCVKGILHLHDILGKGELKFQGC